MKYEKYAAELKSRLEKHFQVDTDVMIFENKIDIYAKFTDTKVRTFITKNDVIDKYENHEYCYVKQCGCITEEEASSFGRFLKRVADECVKPGKDHMSTNVTGVLAGNDISGNARKFIEKYRYSKVYSFYLRGWCDVSLICIGLSNNEVITNKAGRKIKKQYQSILAE